MKYVRDNKKISTLFMKQGNYHYIPLFYYPTSVERNSEVERQNNFLLNKIDEISRVPTVGFS
jgi:hypothetical protein